MESNSPWTVVGWVGLWTAALGLVGLLLRQIGPWRKQISEAEERMRSALEASLEKEREAHAADLERERLDRAAEARAYALERDEMGDRIAKLERQAVQQQNRHRAEISLYRHKFKNITSCFDAMLLLLELNPDKGPEIIAKIKEMRATQMLAEAEEAAIIRAAEIAADEGEADYD